jgi:hypothetical protein
MRIELIPLIELPTLKFPDLEEMTDIDEKNRLLIERNYSTVKNLIPLNELQYKLEEISDIDLKKAIDLHISDLNIEETCALFGGYALKVNDKYLLFPQCCGLLSEINDWKKILDPNFEPFYLTECHPSPEFKKVGNQVIIECDSSHEDFYPKTQKFLAVDYESLVTAINEVCSDLENFSKRLDKFNSEYQTESVSKKMIWEE